MSDAAYMRHLRAARNAAGVCLDCAKPRDSRFKRCLFCRTGLVIRVDRAVWKRRHLNSGAMPMRSGLSMRSCSRAVTHSWRAM